MAFQMNGSVPVSKLVFQKYDRDNSGTITIEEFKDLCYSTGHYLSDEEATLAVKRLDTSGDGSISYPEFAAWWSQRDRFGNLHLSEAELHALQTASNYFKYFDTDKGGSLDRVEFARLHADLVKNHFTTKSLEESLAELDANGDNSVGFNEYIDWLIKIGSLKIRSLR
eukprot:TRINITY_DN18297_c0_g1_i1.p2 TRINITY_DN18297_c0_g1~~TRINITY_DN18297_c0_g1_i1.p2  ORF type:complete len:168 (-),score=33.08 TRINITY_DN18297_c0_g1_i1:51-554(-)